MKSVLAAACDEVAANRPMPAAMKAESRGFRMVGLQLTVSGQEQRITLYKVVCLPGFYPAV
ncbi:hypothetical protein METHP15_10161 [Pseudomonas sp. P15-2025]